MDAGATRMKTDVLLFRPSGGQGRVVRHGTATDEDLYGFNLVYKITFREL